MAKKTIKKYYRRKGRWSANIKTLSDQQITAPVGSFFNFTDLCSNPIQSDNSVSQQYTVKNTEVSFEMEIDYNGSGNTSIESLIGYIMYVPQGMPITETLPNNHPEYIMSMKFYGSPQYENQSKHIPLKIRTRLARRLQTGDKIVLLLTGYNSGSSTYNIKFNGIIRWWTKAN